MDRPRLILAVDGGGTKTRAALAEPAGAWLAERVGGPCNLYQDPEAGLAEIRRLWLALCGEAVLDPAEAATRTAISAGLAGASAPGSGARFAAAFADFGGRFLSSDGYTTLLGALAGRPGALMAIGTGVVGYRLFADGSHRCLSGWGFPVGDRGSGAWIGLTAVGDWLERRDGYGPDAASRLWPRLEERLGAGRTAILGWLKTARPAEFAALAPLVIEAADAGDAYARGLLAAAGEHHLRLAKALAPTQAEPLILAGGLAPVSRPFLEAELGVAIDSAGGVGTPLDGARLVALGRNPPEYECS